MANFDSELTNALTGWWEDYGGDPGSPEWLDFIQYEKQYLGEKLAEISREHTNILNGKHVFGMSKAGGCTRAAGLKLLGYAPEPFDGSSLVTFHIGHLIECMALATVKVIGTPLTGTQQPVSIEDWMQSVSDEVITMSDGAKIPVSVKSMGYKFSRYDRKKKKGVRQGFAELPFKGYGKAQPNGWAQLQAEMSGWDVNEGLVVVAAKDIVKAYKDDPYMQSLTFYTETIPRDVKFLTYEFYPVWQEAWESVQLGDKPRPMFLRPDHTYVELPEMADVDSGWQGPNQKATGTFNPCFGCDFAEVCK